MPICRKCGQSFPSILLIDGKRHPVGGKRKYCLECSPFGRHNTRKLEFLDGSGEVLTCTLCNRSYVYARSGGHTRTLCNSCKTNRNKTERKQKCLDYKGGRCEICGYNRCKEALAFHHTDPTRKDFSISGAHCHPWKRVQEELDKCVLVCANCHAEIHSRPHMKIKVARKRTRLDN